LGEETTATGSFPVLSSSPVESDIGTNNTHYPLPILFYVDWSSAGSLTNSTFHYNATGSWTSESATISNLRTKIVKEFDYTYAGETISFYFRVTNSYGNTTQSSTYNLSMTARNLVKITYYPSTINGVFEKCREWMFRSKTTGYYHLFFKDETHVNYDAHHIFSKNGINWDDANRTQLDDVLNGHIHMDFEMWYNSTSDITYFDSIWTKNGGTGGQHELWYGRWREHPNGSVALLNPLTKIAYCDTQYPIPPENEYYTYADLMGISLDVTTDGYAVVEYFFATPYAGKTWWNILVNGNRDGTWVNSTTLTVHDIEDGGYLYAGDINNLLWIGAYLNISGGGLSDTAFMRHSSNGGASWSSFVDTGIHATGGWGESVMGNPKCIVLNNTFYVIASIDDSPYPLNLYRIDPDNSWAVESLGTINATMSSDDVNTFPIYDSIFNRLLLIYKTDAYRWYYLNNNTFSDEVKGVLFTKNTGSVVMDFGTYSQNPTRRHIGAMDENGISFTYYEFNPTGSPLSANNAPTTSSASFTNLNDGRFILAGLEKEYALELVGYDSDGASDISTHQFALELINDNWINGTYDASSFSCSITAGSEYVNILQVSRTNSRLSQTVTISIRFAPSTPLTPFLDCWYQTTDSSSDVSGWTEYTDLAEIVLYEEGGGGGGGGGWGGGSTPSLPITPKQPIMITNEPEIFSEEYLIEVRNPITNQYINLFPIPWDWTEAQKLAVLWILLIIILLLVGAIYKMSKDSAKKRSKEEAKYLNPIIKVKY